MNIKILIGAVVGALALAVGAYFFGYSNARTKGELAIETMKKENAEAIVTAQQEVKKDYEKRMQALQSELARVRNSTDKRVRELERFKASASTDLATCNDLRNRLATTAVGLEEVADRAISMLESCRR